jgi:3'-5' exoribonuclease
METVSIRELKQQAGTVFQAYRFHAQLDRLLTKTTKTGNPFYELTFADAEETLLLRVWNNSPMFATCGQLRSGQFFEVSGEFGLGGDGRSIDGKTWTARALDEDEAAQVLGGTPELREKQETDYAYIETAAATLADPRLRALSLAFLDRYGKHAGEAAVEALVP